MSALRVLHVVEAMHQGGAETLVVEHVRHAGAGVESLVCALNRGGPAMEAAEALGARTFVLGDAPDRLSRLIQLARLMRSERVAVANGHNPTGGLYAALAGKLAGVPVVVRTEHSIHYRGRHSALYPSLIEPLVTLLTRRVIGVCEAVRESHAVRLRWAESRFVTIANGISQARAARAREAVRNELGIAEGDRVVLTIASLTPQKAQHVLIDAFAWLHPRVPGARLLIAGEGPLQAALESRARASGAGDRVRFLGPRADVADLVQAADLFALSSVREGLPITLLEAMRAGCPAVATHVGGAREAIEDGVTGRIVPPGEPVALGQALLELLSDPVRARALGAAGRERWARCFTAERMVSETEALYRAELRARGVRLPAGRRAGEGRASA